MTEVEQQEIVYADDDEGFFDGEKDGADDDDPRPPSPYFFEEEDEPIGWINGRPANESPLLLEEDEDDGDVEMEDAEAVFTPDQGPDLIPSEVVTDNLVREWIDPLSNYVVDAAAAATTTRGKRRNAEHTQRFFCYYCKKGIDGEPFYSPHPDSTIQCPVADLEYPFCHATCGKGWATWEVGEPLSVKLCQVIDTRAGYVAPVAPAPYELLVNQMGGLLVQDNFVNGEGARQARHKDGKVDRE